MKSKDYIFQTRKKLKLLLVAIFALLSVVSVVDCAAREQGGTSIDASSFSQVDYRYNRRGYGYDQYRRWPYQQYYQRPYYPRQYYRPPYYQRPQYQCWYVPVYDRYGYVTHHRRVCR